MLNKNDLLIDLWCQSKRPEMFKKRFSHYTCCNLRDLGGHENWSKMEVQMAPTSHQHWSLGCPRSHFWSFYGFRQACFCWCFFVRPKGGPKSWTNQLWGGMMAPINNPAGPLSWQILGRLHILLFDNAWHRPVSADFGTHWILKGSPNRAISYKINIKL